ncbi:MAG: uncharacterized protein QOE41_2274, partial [Mycobacterium sp.]|nr:uncharacterized protein [Mycobacterium sp.]
MAPTSTPALDRPWRRPGALRYALRRLRAFVAPPVTVTEPTTDIVSVVDAEVLTRDGTVLRVNVYRPRGNVAHPVVMCAHPYGKDR